LNVLRCLKEFKRDQVGVFEGNSRYYGWLHVDIKWLRPKLLTCKIAILFRNSQDQKAVFKVLILERHYKISNRLRSVMFFEIQIQFCVHFWTKKQFRYFRLKGESRQNRWNAFIFNQIILMHCGRSLVLFKFALCYRCTTELCM
jgi:hypothetical protein